MKRKALVNLIRGSPTHLIKVLRLQALFRGHFCRKRNKQIILAIARNAPKRTSKYKKISKLQANIKGFLFRARRKRLLQKVKGGLVVTQSKRDLNEDMEDLEEFNAEDFFGINEEQLEQNKQEDDDLMLKAI